VRQAGSMRRFVDTVSGANTWCGISVKQATAAYDHRSIKG
jgi:hypothetical protein